MRFLKWIITCQAIALTCIDIAFYLTDKVDNRLKQGLFSFGWSTIFGYWIDLITKVYKSL